MKYFGFLLLLLCLMSCDYFDKKKVNAEDILNEELRTFNWNEVDEYPSFITCDSTLSKEDRKQCFQNTLVSSITETISASGIIVTESINDTLLMIFQVSENGDLELMSIESNDLIDTQIPHLDSLLANSISELPPIYPALKRGQQVRTEFKIPIVINAN